MVHVSVPAPPVTRGGTCTRVQAATISLTSTAWPPLQYLPPGRLAYRHRLIPILPQEGLKEVYEKFRQAFTCFPARGYRTETR